MNLISLLATFLAAAHLIVLMFSDVCCALPPASLEAYVITSDGVYHSVKVNIRDRQNAVEIPVNQRSVVRANYYEATFILNGKRFITAIPERIARDMEDTETHFRKNGTDHWDISRTTGGISSGTYKGPGLIIKQVGNGLFLPTNVTARMNFSDFAGGGDRGREIERDPAGNAVARSFNKPFDLERDTSGKIRFKGILGKTDLSSINTQDLRNQRFIIDFGDHPDRKDKKLIYPVYVQDFNGPNALIIPPSELIKLEKARQGEEISVQLYSVPIVTLRRVPPGAEGDAFLQQRRIAFVNDSTTGVKPIFQAKPIDYQYQFKVKAGADLNESFTSLNRSVRGCDGLGDI